MPEKSAKLTKHEEELLSSDGETKIVSNQDWEFVQENASKLLPKKVPKVSAQRPTGVTKLPDVETPDWTDH
jgi:hypothetical protein